MRYPSPEVVAAVEQAEREHHSRWFMAGNFECVCGALMTDGTDEVHRAHRSVEVDRAAEEAALRVAAERMYDLSRGTPLAAAIAARAAAKRLDHWADELTDTDDRSK